MGPIWTLNVVYRRVQNALNLNGSSRCVRISSGRRNQCSMRYQQVNADLGILAFFQDCADIFMSVLKPLKSNTFS